MPAEYPSRTFNGVKHFVGTRRQVMDPNSPVTATWGGLTARDLFRDPKDGRIKSVKKSRMQRNNEQFQEMLARQQEAGYFRKGEFNLLPKKSKWGDER